MYFAISDFVRRQTKDSEFSYFDGTDNELLSLVAENFVYHKKGYRDGVVLVPVPPAKFYSAIVLLKLGDKLVGEYKARRHGERPTKEIRAANGEKTPAGLVDIVLYRHDVLVENNEQSSNADWEIISINASIGNESVPLTPSALLRNYFCEEGGTDTQMSPEEFVRALRVSMEYWRDKCLVASKI